MAEYIKKEEVLDKLESYHWIRQEDEDNDELNTNVIEDIIEEVPTADVVERSEYEKLKLKLNLMSECGNTLLEKYNDLYCKIDRAIEEIEKQKKIIIEYDGESDLGIAIRIIKEYLGEVEE